MRRRKEAKQPAKEFAKENWPIISLVSGGVVAGVGTAIILLIKYHKYIRDKKGSESDEMELDMLEEDAEMAIPDTNKLLTTGASVAEIIPDADKLSRELAEGLKGKEKSSMLTLGFLKKQKK